MSTDEACSACELVMMSPPANASFDEFFLTEYPRLVPLLAARCGDRALAEDIAQEALLQACRHWDEICGLQSPGGWVRRVALNRSVDEHRRRVRRSRARPLRTAQPMPSGIELPDAELWEAVRRLPRHQRDAVLLHYVDDLPLDEVADSIGCGVGTVKTHLKRARAALARSLDHLNRNTHQQETAP